MKLTLYDLWYHLEEYDENCNELDCYEMVSNVLNCFVDDDKIVLFSIQEGFMDDDLINKKFVEDRIIFINKEWIYNIPIPESGIPNIIWFKASNLEEFKKSLQIDYFFNCAVIKQGCTVRDAEYIINSNEDLECNSLSISEKCKGDFVNKIVPKLKIIFKNDLEIIDKRSNIC